jgi:hypothetical protein
MAMLMIVFVLGCGRQEPKDKFKDMDRPKPAAAP